MLQIIIKTFIQWFQNKNRWWVPLIAGALFPLCLPPFNHETHWAFALFPLLNFVALIPFFFFATRRSLKKSLLYTYLFSFASSVGQYYWIGLDSAEGLWHLVIIGTILGSGLMAVYYWVAGILFRLSMRHLGRWYVLLFPSVFILVDYYRTLGEISFPWAFMGYSLIPYLPLAQIASITGVWGLTFLIVIGNILIYEALRSAYVKVDGNQKWLHVAVFSLFLSICSIWGWTRMSKPLNGEHSTISLLQSNIDQLNWGNNSLDTSFTITKEMYQKAASSKPDLIILPESALLCYLDHRSYLKEQVFSWVDSLKVPIILGSLDWQRAPKGSLYDYLVYNTAFNVDPGSHDMKRYYKIKLVPFSETLPFEGKIPVLSRVNLGEADFQRGKENTVFTIGKKIFAAPLICYEIIYPDFVRQRVKSGANLIVNITNDGWFGKSSGPFQHAMMSRMRSIENGVTLARCANSGFSMFVDPYGRILGQTGLFTREILSKNIPIQKVPSFYNQHGDWLVKLSLLILFVGIVVSVSRRLRKPFPPSEIVK